MGIDYHASIGPYVICKITKKLADRPVDHGCHNEKCDLQGVEVNKKHKFCSDCGFNLGKTTTSFDEDSVDHWDMSEKIKEALYIIMGDSASDYMKKHKIHIWAANCDYKPSKEREKELNTEQSSHFSCDVLTTNFEIVEISARSIEIDLEAFEEKFTKEIGILKKSYGEENVTIKWGFILTVS